MQSVVKIFEGVNKTFNVMGRVPFVSSATGMTRTLVMPYLQVAVGAVATPIGYSLGGLSRVVGFNNVANYMFRMGHNGIFLVVDGVGNSVRGIAESVPFLGNTACYAYDKLRHGKNLLISPAFK